MSSPSRGSTDKPIVPVNLREVRYSLPELLADVQIERAAPAYANEQLEQVEIAKLFEKNRPRRAKRKSK